MGWERIGDVLPKTYPLLQRFGKVMVGGSERTKEKRTTKENFSYLYVWSVGLCGGLFKVM